MGEKLVEINLFGACMVRSCRPGHFEINSAKHRALFVLLATAPFGRRTRTFLQDALWGMSCYDTGRQSLRRALSDIKQILGEDFSKILTSTNSDLVLNLDVVRFIGTAGKGVFLEGLDIKEEGFNDWLRGIRLNPSQLDALFSLRTGAPTRPAVPVVAILPFRAIDDSSAAILGDWIAEETCRSLSRSNLLAVISHLSSREFARHWIDMARIRNDLKADFCLVGTIRSLGDMIILDADFVDSASGQIMWTRRFTGKRDSYFYRSAESIAEITGAIGRAIADEAIHHVLTTPPASIADHKLLIAGVNFMHSSTLDEFARSRSLIETALSRAPRSAEIHAWLSKWYVLSVFNGWTSDTKQDTALALDHAARALDINPENAFCLTIDGFAHNNLLHRLDIAEARYKRALHFNPNEALSWLLNGALHAFRDEADEAVRCVGTARDLSPLDPLSYFFQSLSATAHLAAGHYDVALEFADRSLAQNDRHLSTLRAKISALYHLGRLDEARDAGAELMRRQPSLTVAGYLRDHPAAQFRIGQGMARALQGIGIS